MRDVGDSISTASSINARLAEAASKEFFWGCELSKEKPTVQWNFEEEEDDQDFLEHTLFLRHAILGKGITKDERNIVEIETKNFAGDEIKQPIISLTGGKLDMCHLDLNFGHEIPVTFRLVEGSGPVFLSAQQLVEFPQEVEEDEFLTATDTETECTDEEELDEVEDLKGKKRKANGAPGSKKKKGKLDAEASNGTDEDEDEEEEDEEDDDAGDEEEMETSDEDEEEEDDDDDDEEDEEEDESPKKKSTKGKKGRQSAGSAKNIKKNKPKPKAKKPAKKGKAK